MNDLIISKGDLNLGFALALRDIIAEEKLIKDRKEHALNRLKEAMEQNGIIKIDNEFFTVSYIAESDREYFDAKALRADKPELYDEYVTMKPVKASVRVKVK